MPQGRQSGVSSPRTLSWHWIFLVNIPIGIIGILFAARVIPGDEPEDHTVSFDYPGAVTLFGAMVFCTFVLEEVAARGVTDPLILVCGALCLLCSGLFVIRELTIPEPFLNIRIFSKWQFTAVLVAYLLVNVIFMGIIYLLPFYLTMEMHFDLATSGLYLLIPPAVIALISIPFGQWSDRHGRRDLRSPPAVLSSSTAPSLQSCPRNPGLFPCLPASS